MTSAHASPLRARSDLLVSALFAVALCAPAVDECLRHELARGPGPERRTPAPLPGAPVDVRSWTSFPAAWQAHFDDTFGLRDKFLRWNSIVQYEWLRVSPAKDLVVGADGWIFYAGDSTFEVLRGVDPFRPEELEAWRVRLEQRRDFVASLGAHYLFVVCPNKETIYSERLPARFAPVGPTRLDQLSEFLRAHSTVELLDLRPALLAEKVHDHGDDFLYNPLGTHWHGRGAFTGYRAILEHLAPHFATLHALSPEQCHVETSPWPGDSWGLRLYIQDRLWESERTFVAQEGPAATMVEEVVQPNHLTCYETPRERLPRAIVLRDSFMDWMEDLFVRSFSRVWLCSTWELDPALVAAEHPDVVVEMYVERALVTQSAPAILGSTQRSAQSLAAGIEPRGPVLFQLDPTRENFGIEPGADESCRVESRAGDRSLVLSSHGARDGFTVHLPHVPGDGRVVITVDMTTSGTNVLDLFYKSKGESQYSRLDRGLLTMHPGRERRALRMTLPAHDVALYVRPRDRESTFTLHAFDVRAFEP